MFLTDTDLQSLTGYQLPSAQKRWLVKHGWRFEVSAFGRPKVLIEYARQRLGVATDDKPAQNQPDFTRWKSA